MAWTYEGNPGTADADQRRDSVRYLTGDTDVNDQLITDQEIAFLLDQTSNSVFKAASLAAETIAAKFSRLVNFSFDSVSTDYSDLAEGYRSLSVRLDQKARSVGGGLGTPSAGGISVDQMDDIRSDEDRPLPAFRRRMFSNPPQDYKVDDNDYLNRR